MRNMMQHAGEKGIFDSPILHFPLINNANEVIQGISTNNFNVTFNGSEANFNNIDSYINVPDNAFINLGNNPFTYTFWAARNSGTTGTQGFLQKASSYTHRFRGATAGDYVANGNVSQTVTRFGYFAVNVFFTLYGISYDGNGTFGIFIRTSVLTDHTTIYNASFTGHNTNANPLTIGYAGGSYWLGAKMKNLRLYDFYATTELINELFAKGENFGI